MKALDEEDDDGGGSTKTTGTESVEEALDEALDRPVLLSEDDPLLESTSSRSVDPFATPLIPDDPPAPAAPAFELPATDPDPSDDSLDSTGLKMRFRAAS